MQKPTYRFVNKDTGEEIITNPDEVRVGRMRRRTRAWSRAVDGIKSDLILVTLTYRDIYGWSRRHVSQFMRHVREYMGDRLLAYMWVAELQRRGAVHYHVLLRVSCGSRIPLPDDAGWWKHGMTRVQLVRDAARVGGYVRKYVSKGENGEFPPGLRLFAVVVRRVLGLRVWRLRWYSVPQWVNTTLDEMGVIVQEGDSIHRVSGGWIISGCGVVSPWRFERITGGKGADRH